MKSLLNYYVALIFPLLLLFLLKKIGLVDSTLFTITILGYALVYHPIATAMRLRALNLISKSGSWKVFMPFYTMGFFEQLFLGRNIESK